MQGDITRILKQYQQFLYSKFRRSKQEAIEMLLMPAFGRIFTPNQMDEISIDRNKVYRAINSWSIYLLTGCQETVKVSKERFAMSPATPFRARIAISVDDRIIPLCIKPVGEQGRANTTKPGEEASSAHEVDTTPIL